MTRRNKISIFGSSTNDSYEENLIHVPDQMYTYKAYTLYCVCMYIYGIGIWNTNFQRKGGRQNEEKKEKKRKGQIKEINESNINNKRGI